LELEVEDLVFDGELVFREGAILKVIYREQQKKKSINSHAYMCKITWQRRMPEVI